MSSYRGSNEIITDAQPIRPLDVARLQQRQALKTYFIQRFESKNGRLPSPEELDQIDDQSYNCTPGSREAQRKMINTALSQRKEV